MSRRITLRHMVSSTLSDDLIVHILEGAKANMLSSCKTKIVIPPPDLVGATRHFSDVIDTIYLTIMNGTLNQHVLSLSSTQENATAAVMQAIVTLLTTLFRDKQPSPAQSVEKLTKFVIGYSAGLTDTVIGRNPSLSGAPSQERKAYVLGACANGASQPWSFLNPDKINLFADLVEAFGSIIYHIQTLKNNRALLPGALPSVMPATQGTSQVFPAQQPVQRIPPLNMNAAVGNNPFQSRYSGPSVGSSASASAYTSVSAVEPPTPYHDWMNPKYDLPDNGDTTGLPSYSPSLVPDDPNTVVTVQAIPTNPASNPTPPARQRSWSHRFSFRGFME